MRWVCLFAASAATLFGQTSPFNAAGVTQGHIHLMVNDVDAHKKAWTDLFGAIDTPLGMRIAGVYIAVTQAKPSGGSEGSTVNHIGLLVPNYAATKQKIAAAGHTIVFDIENNKQMMVEFPDGVRVEINEDASLKTPSALHHIHMTAVNDEELRDWYVKMFGALSTSRRNMPAAGIPGGEVDFLKARDAAPVGTKGRAIDHIGFDVKDLAALVAKLKAQGVVFEGDIREVPQMGLKVAFLSDPTGTRIELTQGLMGR
jgi:catechol 2,3-dioxygenase-like lactoylglutathione lyase family enzyme